MPRPAAPLQLTLLGGFEARVAGGLPIAFSRRKAQALLAYLALKPGQAQPRDKLAALLWGDATDERARHSLRQVLVSLRRALAATTPQAVVEEGDTVAIDPTAIDVDVAAFERLVATGTLAALAEAATVYRGDLLAGLSVQEAPLEEWLLSERERLRELAVDALAKLLGSHMASGTIEPAVQTAMQLLALDPTQEAVHRALMELYDRLGRRGAALRQYQVCVGVLERELGAVPETETRELYEQLLQAQPPAVSARSGARASVVPDIAPGDADRPLIGREAEIARLREARESAWRGDVSTVLVTGEPGIGKSRLVEALVSDAILAGGHALVGRAWDTQRVLPFGLWIDALRRGRVIPDLVEDLGSPWRTELARLFPELEPRRSETGPGDRARLFEAMARVVEHLASHDPLLVVLEDLHWADEMSLRLLAFVARRVSARPVLLVGTARSDELAEATTLRGLLGELDRHPHALTLTLAPFSEGETVALVRALSQAGTDDRTIRNRVGPVWRLSRGNPFIAVETIRAVRERDVVAGEEEVLVPARVRDVIAGRLERLTPLAQQLATVAAVIGREFDFALLARAADVVAADAARGLEELVGRRIVRAVGERFDFTHDLIRDVAHARSLVPRRRMLHGQVAAALEQLYASHLDPHSAALAAHWQAAEAWPQAVAALARLAETATRAYAAADALAALEDASRLADRLPAGDRDRWHVALTCREAEVLYLLGRIPDAVRRLDEQAVRMQSLHDDLLAGRYHVVLAQSLVMLGEDERAQEAVDRAREAAARSGDRVTLGRAFYLLAYRARWTSPLGEVLEYAGQAVALLEEAGERYWLGWAWWMTGVALALGGRWPDALAANARVSDIAEALGDRRMVGYAIWARGWILAASGDTEAGVEACRRALAQATDPTTLVNAKGALGYALLERGDATAAIPWLEETVAQLAQFRVRQSLCLFTACLAEAYRAAGRAADARARAAEALTLSRWPGNPHAAGWAERTLGRLALDDGDGAAAAAHLNSALTAFRRTDALGEVARTLRDLDRLAVPP